MGSSWGQDDGCHPCLLPMISVYYINPLRQSVSRPAPFCLILSIYPSYHTTSSRSIYIQPTDCHTCCTFTFYSRSPIQNIHLNAQKNSSRPPQRLRQPIYYRKTPFPMLLLLLPLVQEKKYWLFRIRVKSHSPFAGMSRKFMGSQSHVCCTCVFFFGFSSSSSGPG